MGETEFTNKYIDPILSALFTNHESNYELRWPSLGTPESKVHDLVDKKHRPDSIISSINQHEYDYSKGYGEVKTIEQQTNNYELCRDLLRVAIFNKDSTTSKVLVAIVPPTDSNNRKFKTGYQVVGAGIVF